MRTYEHRDRGIARPHLRKPVPEPAQSVERDADGFDLYICSQCAEKKIAALFNPGQIVSSELLCMACTGEATRHPAATSYSRKIKHPARSWDGVEACA